MEFQRVTFQVYEKLTVRIWTFLLLLFLMRLLEEPLARVTLCK